MDRFGEWMTAIMIVAVIGSVVTALGAHWIGKKAVKLLCTVVLLCVIVLPAIPLLKELRGRPFDLAAGLPFGQDDIPGGMGLLTDTVQEELCKRVTAELSRLLSVSAADFRLQFHLHIADENTVIDSVELHLKSLAAIEKTDRFRAYLSQLCDNLIITEELQKE